MSQLETLMARDGHAFCAYIAKPAGHPRGGVVIVHEIFGLTPQMRRVADSYAAEGYLAVAPALFDRIRRDLVLGGEAIAGPVAPRREPVAQRLLGAVNERRPSGLGSLGRRYRSTF